MSVVAFVNGEIGARVLPILAQRSALHAVVVHPSARARERDLFEGISAAAGAILIEAPSLKDADCRERLRVLKPEWGLSAGFGYILRPQIFEIPKHGTLNVHTALLPWNRGAHPNVWTLVDETPAGVSLHWIDAGVDTGDILLQSAVQYDWTDTAETLQRKLLGAAEALVAEHWPPTAELVGQRHPQGSGGSTHRIADLTALDELDLDRMIPVRRLLNILRARTYPPFRAAGIRTSIGFVEMPLSPRHPSKADGFPG